MGFLKNITRQISIKNISPVAKVVSIVKKPVQKVVSTGKVGFKDVLAVSPVGVAVGLAKQGTSQIKDVAMGNEPIPEEIIEETVVDDTLVDDTNTVVGKDVTKKEDGVPDKEKNKLPMYIGLGLGGLVLVGAIFYFVNRKK
jgi:hypothetical protein